MNLAKDPTHEKNIKFEKSMPVCINFGSRSLFNFDLLCASAMKNLPMNRYMYKGSIRNVHIFKNLSLYSFISFPCEHASMFLPC
jgi:hypothetical protein